MRLNSVNYFHFQIKLYLLKSAETYLAVLHTILADNLKTLMELNIITARLHQNLVGGLADVYLHGCKCLRWSQCQYKESW